MLVIGWCPNAVRLAFTKFMVGNHCCCDLGGHAHNSSAVIQPSLSCGACNSTYTWANSDCMHEGGWALVACPYPVGLSLTDACWLTPYWTPLGPNTCMHVYKVHREDTCEASACTLQPTTCNDQNRTSCI